MELHGDRAAGPDPRPLLHPNQLLDLVEGAGLAVEHLRSTVADPLAVEVDVDRERLPPTVVEWVRHQPEALNYQFVVSAVRARAGEVRPAA